MHRSPFEPCIPSPANKVPDSKNWIHEIKHDGYRLIVQHDGERVRLFTRMATTRLRDNGMRSV
jgi:bifunctional non-homologous end joining protein LigD